MREAALVRFLAQPDYKPDCCCSSRASVTAWLHQIYCACAAFARLPAAIDNPDQRMAADVGRWAEELGRLAAVFAAAPLKVPRRPCSF